MLRLKEVFDFRNYKFIVRISIPYIIYARPVKIKRAKNRDEHK